MRIVFVGRDRPVLPRILLNLVTLGISRRVWLYRINREIDGHDALGLRHGVIAALLCLPLGGPAWVTWRTAVRTASMVKGSGVEYGRPGLVALPALVPILGGCWFIAWEQSRLNRFWAHERVHPEHGVEIDLDIREPQYLLRLEAARRESYRAASRFEGKRRIRKAIARQKVHFGTVGAQRRAVREAGGSTPVLPFLKPKPPEPRLLRVTCGRCEHRFNVRQDPMQDTPVLCPSCGLLEVLPGLASDPLARPEPALVPQVRATCASCGKQFHAVRSLVGPTPLSCPHCGATGSLPPPHETAGLEDAPAKARMRRASA